MARPVDEETQEKIEATRERRKAIGQARVQKSQEKPEPAQQDQPEQQSEGE